ncbi:MAG: trigger factor [Planctomycetaceae bacterium]
MSPSAPQSDAGAATAEESQTNEPQTTAEDKPLVIEVQVTPVSTCERRVRVTVSREEIDRYYEKAVGDLMPNALLPGFRPGRAPRSLVSNRFKTELKDQIRSKLLTDAMEQVSDRANVSPISEPDLDVGAVVLPDEGPMTFEFGLEVRPEFELPKWKGLSIQRPSREISESDVDDAIGRFLRERGRLVPFDGKPANGDLLVANLRFLTGEDVLSQAEEVEIVVRPSLSFADGEVDGFDAIAAKATIGKPFTADVRLSPDAVREDLRGGMVTMEMTVLELKRFEPPALTPTLLEEIGGFDSAEAFRSAVRRQLENRLEYHRRRKVRQQVAEALTSSASWELPPALLRRQSQRELERAILELRRSGFDDDAIRQQVNYLRQNVMESTARALKEHFILERLAEEQSVSDDPSDYDDEIRAIAAQSGESPRRVRASLEKRGLMDVLRNQIIERKTIDLITSQASFKDVPFEFESPQTDAIDHAVCGRWAGEEDIPTATRSEAMDLRSVVRR